jgi:hypothetical protein
MLVEVWAWLVHLQLQNFMLEMSGNGLACVTGSSTLVGGTTNGCVGIEVMVVVEPSLLIGTLIAAGALDKAVILWNVENF